MSLKTGAFIALYLGAIVAANLITTEFGPSASIYNAFFLIGLNLTVRDALHDMWERHRFLKMAALIATGSALAYAVNADAGKVALASFAAFAAAETVDAVMYHALKLRGVRWLERVTSSNFLSSAVDSIVFPTIAFSGVMWSITFGQFVAKVAGGLVFALLLNARRTREPEAVPA